VDLWHTPEIGAALRRRFGAKDDVEVYAALGLDKIVWVFMDYQTEVGERAGAQSGAGAESGGNHTMGACGSKASALARAPRRSRLQTTWCMAGSHGIEGRRSFATTWPAIWMGTSWTRLPGTWR